MLKKIKKYSIICTLLLVTFCNQIYVAASETNTVNISEEKEIFNEIEDLGNKSEEMCSSEYESTEDDSESLKKSIDDEIIMDVENTEEQKESSEAIDTYALDEQSIVDMVEVQYRAHVSNIGWQTYVSAGEMAGTVWEKLPMEAIQIEIDGVEDLGITYQAHVSNIGWQSFVSDGAIAGTTGKAISMEAIKIKLTGENADLYDVYYRAHVTDIGWMAWAKNGEPAGTEGYAYTLQALEIRVVPTGTEVQDNNDASAAYKGKLRITHQAYVQNKGWMSVMGTESIAGTTGRNLSMNAIKLSTNNAYEIGIAYSTHVSNIGWQDYVYDGEIAGITGTNNVIEAIKIKLTGESAEKYDIYYRAHVANIGWLDWTKNDEVAGSFGLAYAVQALDIRIVEKDGSAPGSTSCAYLRNVSIDYKSLVDDIEWQETVSNGAVSGTTGKNLPLKALKIRISNFENVGVKYRTHVSNIGWQEYVTDDSVAGVETVSEQIEAIQIELTGSASGCYDIWYRVHSANLGWLDWTKNGEKAGTSSLGYSAQAIQIMVCVKGTVVPGTTKTAYVDHIEKKQESESFIWPVPSSKRITSYFGYRTQPTAGASTYHQGIDIGATYGSAIVACKSGTVTACSYNSIRGYYVEITHGDGMKTIYMHMSSQAVSKGTKVSQGQVIGYVGSSGVATGPHLHLSVVKNGTNVNPLDYVKL